MGTRADFYVGRGANAEWLGSIGWDGYPSGVFADGDTSGEYISLLDEINEPGWRSAVTTFFSKRDDVTRPANGWPWPWDDSRTTDYAYAWDDGKVYGSSFGHDWFDVEVGEPEDDDEYLDGPKSAVFPNMKEHKNVQLGSKQSGVIVLGG